MKVTLLAENEELHQELCTSLADGHFQFADIITKPPVLFVEVFIVKIFKVLCKVEYDLKVTLFLFSFFSTSDLVIGGVRPVAIETISRHCLLNFVAHSKRALRHKDYF